MEYLLSVSTVAKGFSDHLRTLLGMESQDWRSRLMAWTSGDWRLGCSGSDPVIDPISLWRA